MDKKVYIIHGSAIVQNGIAGILLKNFKCTIRFFNNFSSLTESNDDVSSDAILFVEDRIAESEEFGHFLKENDTLNTLITISSDIDKAASHNHYTLSLYNSSDEIYEKIKSEFYSEVFTEEASEELTNREIDVLKLIANGHSNKEIADKLFISIHTVMSHRKNITEKLGIKSISGLTVYAIINNYIDTKSLDPRDLM